MINSWKSFVHAVDQMRQLQKKENIKNSPDLHLRLKRLEAEIDDACDKKIAEWNATEDLFASAGYTP
jgi:hypothetical protein